LNLRPLVVVGWIVLGWALPLLATGVAFLRDRRRTLDLALVSGMSCFGLMMMNQTRLIPSLNHFLQVSTTPYILLGFALTTAVKPWLARRLARRRGRRAAGAALDHHHLAHERRRDRSVPGLIRHALERGGHAAGSSRRRPRSRERGRRDHVHRPA